MRRRCSDPNYSNYRNYGARGITVCEAWGDFSTFLADMGERPPGKSIDRIDTNGNYEPGNCRWSTQKEQMTNVRTNRRVTIDGETMTLMQWAERIGIGYWTVQSRLKYGWPVERALTEPVRKSPRRSSPPD